MGDPSIETPSLLVAMPQVQDPFFQRGVVLLVDHNHEGSFGFVVNRITDLMVASVLSELEIEWPTAPDLPALLGGPVNPQLGTVLMPTVSARALGDDVTLEIAPGISISQNVEVLQRLAESPPSTLRLVLGYSGWSPGQLDEEIARHDWLVCPVDSDLVFSEEIEKVWEGALLQLGINSADLPEWPQSDESVN